jgi:hypothetical protein
MRTEYQTSQAQEHKPASPMNAPTDSSCPVPTLPARISRQNSPDANRDQGEATM